jgi:thioredoxin 1
MTIDVTDSSFAGEVLASPLPVLVDFWAQWCQPCKAMAPTLDELAADLEGKIKIVKVDVDANPGIAAQFSVRAMPTLIIFKAGQPIDIKAGAGQSKANLVRWLEPHMPIY